MDIIFVVYKLAIIKNVPSSPAFSLDSIYVQVLLLKKAGAVVQLQKKMTTKNGSKLKKQICESSSMTLKKKVVREAKSSFLLNEANLIDERHTSFPHTIFQCVKQSTLTILSKLNWTSLRKRKPIHLFFFLTDYIAQVDVW